MLCKITKGVRRRIYNKLNKIKLYMAGGKCGSNCHLYDSVYIKNEGTIVIGDDFLMTSGNGYNPLCRNIKGTLVVRNGAKIIIGNHCHMSSPCIWAWNSIIIGNDVKIGGDCIIIDSDAHSLNYEDRKKNKDFYDSNNAKTNEIKIGNDVLIGTRVIILKGVTIGDRAVIGAGSVVTQSIPSDCVAAGNPCKVIKYKYKI